MTTQHDDTAGHTTVESTTEKGRPAGAAKLTAEQRKEIAKKAAARWG